MYDVVPYVLHFCSYRVFVYNRLNFLIRSVISSVNYLFNSVQKGYLCINGGTLFCYEVPTRSSRHHSPLGQGHITKPGMATGGCGVFGP
jgi:hypothetical protein